MLVVIPVHSTDLPLALLNLQLCLKLDKRTPHPALIACERGTDLSDLLPLAERYFTSVTTFIYDPWRGSPSWPAPQNYAWQTVARRIAANERTPWLWWEADATPLRSGWLSTLEAAYQAAALPFAGHIVSGPGNGHMNGVAIYPPNVALYCTNALLTRTQPFDRVLSSEARSRIAPLNQHIGHFLKDHREGIHIDTVDAFDEISASNVVLFHGSSDGSLVKYLIGDSPLIPLMKKRDKAFARAFTAIKPVFPLVGHFDPNSGYGSFTVQLCQAILRRGLNLSARAASRNETEANIPKEIAKLLERPTTNSLWEFIIYPCVIQPTNLVMPDRTIAYMTMWESTRLISKCDPNRTKSVDTMNKCRVVMVPNAWNASIFSACGVDAPIRIAPLSVDTNFFQPVPNFVESTPFVFGTAARTAMGGIRKGFNNVVRAFQRAFPDNPDVRLRVKCFSDDPMLPTGGDKRIDVIKRHMTWEELRDWYASLNVFVSGSACEGWGRHHHEAMCMGRPVIGVNFGGVCEFFNEENGYAVDWTLEPGEGIYRTMGHYAKPRMESIAAKMVEAYEDRSRLNHKVNLAIEYAHRFTIDNSLDKILAILKEFDLFNP